MGFRANQYKKTAVQTASKTQILIMLYEAAVQNVKKASEAIENGDLEAKGIAIGKAHDIINELMNSLDFNVGGNIATELERLYNFMIEQLFQANSKNIAEPLKTTEKLLNTLLDGWRGAIAQVAKEAK